MAGLDLPEYRPGPQDFDGYIEEYEEKLAYFRMEDCVLVDTLEMIVPANWKLVLENFIDVYHFSVCTRKRSARRRTRP